MNYETTRKVYGLISLFSMLGMGICIPMILLNINTILSLLWLMMYMGFVGSAYPFDKYITIDFKPKYHSIAWYKDRKKIINKELEVKNE